MAFGKGDSNMKAVLIRVAIDTGSGGALAPIYPDGTFEYVPIPELVPTMEGRTYNKVRGIKGDKLSKFVPKQFEHTKIHFDPEFKGMTYGDYKSKRLYKLEKDDLVIFYAGLKPEGKKNKYEKGLYAIGYLTVDRVVHIESYNDIDSKFKGLRDNAHVKRGMHDGDYDVVKGVIRKSGLFKKAIKINDVKNNVKGIPYYVVAKDLEEKLGIKGSIQRSVPVRFIDEEHIGNLKKLLKIR